jgi:two-component system, NtrC family, sensor histidine kinase HydH
VSENRDRTDLRALLELSIMINSSLDVQSVLDAAMACVQDHLNAEASTIFELDPEKEELFFRVAIGEVSDTIKHLRLKVGQGVAGWVALMKQPVISSDVHDDPRFTPLMDTKTGFKTRNILCVPLICRGKLIGVLEVLNKKGPTSFDEYDKEILIILGNQIATALENARLYQKLSERFETANAELCEAQRKLLQAERLSALGRLSESIAHEVRNPVTVIGGFAARLQKQLPQSDPNQKIMTIILAETERLERMVADVEHYCKLRAPLLTPIEVDGLLDRALEQVSDRLRRQGIVLRRQGARDLPHVVGDEELLQIALGNIFVNAMEAMPKGGRLELSVIPRAKSLQISIRDSGPGIPPESLGNVLDPFFTTKASGSGFGLSLAHRILSDQGGDINLRTPSEGGTEVLVTLSYAVAHTQAEALGVG